jgi:diguanylate cyclase (GGDEF)-like protein/PAS domain S-box-containing protein
MPQFIKQLRESVAFNASPDGVMWVDQHGDILMINAAMATLSGYTESELVGCSVSIFLPPHLREAHAHSMQSFFTAPNPRAMGSGKMKLLKKNGGSVSVDIALGHWQDADAKFAIAYVRDLSEREAFEDALHFRATRDELTGLPNRWLFNQHLNKAILSARRSECMVAVLMLDLDDFKSINDSFSYALGDQLLLQVAQRLGGLTGSKNTLSRLGEDEFAIMLQGLSNASEAISVTQKILFELQRPYVLNGQEVHCGVSIGLALFPDHAHSSADLLRYADMAMYQAKRFARGSYACYTPELQTRARENMKLHVRLKDAIDRGQLKLLYQPQFDSSGVNIVGAEALVRWHDSVLGDVSPARFIPVAESTGLILALSAWVLETACKQIAAWERAGVPLAVAVNFSAQQFGQGNLAEQVRATLERTGASGNLLKVEVTESIAMDQPDAASDQLHSLIRLGCSVALDDFGTGYSSLAYLKTLPASVLKIDRAFIKDLPTSVGDAKICKAIIALAHNLGMTVVAEGVETDQQLAFLRSYGCDAYQGWLFAKAMDAESLTERLTDQVFEGSVFNIGFERTRTALTNRDTYLPQ